MDFMRRFFFCVAAIILMALGAWRWRSKPVAPWQGLAPARAKTTSQWQAIAPEIEMRTFSTRTSSAFNGAVEITALRTTPQHLKILKGETRNADQWREDGKFLAVMNGGFFDKDGKSLGLRVTDNKKANALHDADWGVFFIRKGKAGVLHTRDFKVKYDSYVNITQAVQCGPRLVVDGKTTDLKPQVARRTGVGIQRDGKVIIAVSDGTLTFSEWANLWADASGLDCRDALNLDGGGSTQISIQTKKKSLEVSGAWPIPDVVAIR